MTGAFEILKKANENDMYINHFIDDYDKFSNKLEEEIKSKGINSLDEHELKLACEYFGYLYEYHQRNAESYLKQAKHLFNMSMLCPEKEDMIKDGSKILREALKSCDNATINSDRTSNIFCTKYASLPCSNKTIANIRKEIIYTLEFPLTSKERKQLEIAVKEERYEDAAVLRDYINGVCRIKYKDTN